MLSLFRLDTGAAETIEGLEKLVLTTSPKANDEFYFSLMTVIAHGKTPDSPAIEKMVSPV